MLHKESVKVNEVEDFTTDSMEALAFTLLSQKSIRIVLLYGPPPRNDIPRRAFLNDLHDILDRLALSARPFIIIGDFNIHWDVENDQERATLHDMCETLDLQQHVDFSTHEDGHTLDLILSRGADNLISKVSQGLRLSDHSAIHFSVNIAKPHPMRKKVSFRKLRQVDHSALN